MRNLLLFCFLLLGTNLLHAQAQKVASTIEKVTVYPQQARIFRKAKANISKGDSELILKNVEQGVNANSIQVKISNKNISLVSVTPKVNYIKVTNPPKEQQVIADSIELLKRALNELVLKEQTLNASKKILQENNPLKTVPEGGYTTERVKKVMNFHEKELSEIGLKLLDLSYERQAITKDRNRLQQQLNSSANSKEKPSGEVVLKLHATSAGSTSIEITYIVGKAGWTPLYDLKSDGIGQPLTLVAKASIYQSTGYDWDQVELKVCTGNPSLNHDRPILTPLKVALTAPKVAPKPPKPQNVARVNRVNNIERNTMAQNSYYADGSNLKINKPVTNLAIDDGDVLANQNHNREFKLALLQTIPNDGRRHIAEIKRYDLTVEYEYHVVPKMDNGAFLLAKITDYGKYDLTSARTNIFFKGVYLGQSFIDTRITRDTLLMSLGRDDDITVSREKISSEHKKNLTNAKEKIAFEVKVRNNKKQTINITILDQIPVSKDNELEVKLLDYSNARYYEPYGSLRWSKKIKPNSTAKMTFKYEVKYPKNRGVVRAR